MKLPFIAILSLILFGCSNKPASTDQKIESDKKNVEIIKSDDSLDIKTSTDTTINDTIFITRETGKDYYHAIYVDENRNSKYYNQVSDFTFDPSVSPRYTRPLKKTLIRGIPLKWCPLKLYKGKYYVYASCSSGTDSRIMFNDSITVEFNMEGANSSPILSFIKVDKETFQLKREDYYYDKQGTITINIIDREKGIAVFENLARNGDKYILMVNANNVRQYPIIVNYCPSMEEDEFEFQKPDFEKLLAKK